MTENVRYLDTARYEELIAYEQRSRERVAPGDTHRYDVAALLYQEARLLDTGRYEQWMTLLSDECIVWVPAELVPRDPRDEASVHFDDRRRLLDRIALIRSGYLHAQMPASRTSRLLGNMECWPVADDRLEVRSTLLITEHRRGSTTHYAGAQEHDLVRESGEWRIHNRIVRLLDCDQPLGNITFII